MRWKIDIAASPKKGDKRIITRFLFLACELNGEVRWLESAKIEQTYEYYDDNEIKTKYIWKNTKWVD